MMLNKRVELLLGNMSASWFFGASIFDLDLGFQIDPVKQHIKRNSVGSGDNFAHRFMIFKNVSLRFALRRICVCDKVIHIR